MVGVFIRENSGRFRDRHRERRPGEDGGRD